MSMANDIYAQRLIEAQAAKAEREEMRLRMRKEFGAWTPRAQRAHRHANMVLAIFDKFIPEACRSEAFKEAKLNFFAQDFEIVPVPPERDAQREHELKAAMMTAPAPQWRPE